MQSPNSDVWEFLDPKRLLSSLAIVRSLRATPIGFRVEGYLVGKAKQPNNGMLRGTLHMMVLRTLLSGDACDLRQLFLRHRWNKLPAWVRLINKLPLRFRGEGMTRFYPNMNQRNAIQLLQ
jgi:hypothetical protein